MVVKEPNQHIFLKYGIRTHKELYYMNLYSLCTTCQRLKDAKFIWYWYKLFRMIMSWIKFVSTLFLIHNEIRRFEKSINSQACGSI